MFNHYLGYIDNKPVSIATLCMENGYGGLYSAGTLPFYRNRGISTSLLAKCIKEFKSKSGEVLFTQTVKGSIISMWLQHNGFDELFSADVFVKRSC